MTDETLDEAQSDLIHRILDCAIAAVEEEWTDLAVSYWIEGDQSAVMNSCLVSEDGAVKERGFVASDELDELLRELHAHLVDAGQEPFTKCRLHATADGQCEVSYDYEPVDWDALMDFDGNFPAAKR
jgi:hypothetical protein